MPLGRLIQRLPEIDILHRLLVGGLPAIALPAMHPALDAVFHILAVGMQIDLAGTVERVQCLDGRRQLHLVIGGQRLAALELLAVLPELQNGAPAAGAGISGTGPVSMNDNGF